ncbi:hypothetical protein H4582DRAFT_2113489 [Lactarius indigo]|nr:hypothetical protein H4582DRAFT_2113489 [Lactarius indigo]
MRSKHRIPPLQAHPIPTPWSTDNLDPQPIENPQPIDDWPNSPPPDPPPADGGVHEEEEGPEWEFHPSLCATPCDKNHVYLPPGTPPTPPPARAPDDWTPYRNHVEFELAKFLYRKVQMSGNDINILSQLWHASLISHGVPPDEIDLFDSRDSLYATIDATPFGDAWMTMTYDVWHQDAHHLLHNMLANPDFDNEFDYVPFREFNAQKRRRWRDFMSGDWAWREADIIANNPETRGAMLVPIILSSDKTTVSVATGHNEYYPVYMLIGNVRNNVRRAHRNAVILLGFLAIPKTDKWHTDDNEFRKFRRQLFHSSLTQILSIIYSIGPYIADYPEQALLACTVQGWCPRCTALPSNLDIGGERRSQELMNALINALDPGSLWDQYSIVRYVTPFTSEFPRADIHELVAPDILHQVIKGTFKDHLVTWVEEYLELTHGKTHAKTILDDIDRR